MNANSNAPTRALTIAGWEEQMAPLAVRRAEASWELATTGAAAARTRLRDAIGEIDALLSDGEAAKLYAGWAAEPCGDAQVDRCATLIANEHATRQAPKKTLAQIASVQTDLQRTFGTFRPEIDGERYTPARIEQIFAQSTDSDERRTAWEAAHAVGPEVADGVRELARLRNRVAKQAGHRDWYAMSLALQELPEEWLLATFSKLDRATREPFRTRKAVLDGRLARRYGIAADALQPWHYADPFFQRMPEAGGVDLDAIYANIDIVDVATRFFDGLGCDVRPVLAKSDLEPREGKNPHAFCTHIDRRGDVRILCNITPSTRWMTTTLHELGHAVYDRYLDRTLPWTLRRPAHTLTTEAIAMLMGRMSHEPEFLAQYADVGPTELKPLVAELRRTQALSMLIFVRWALVMTQFERALYADPDRDDLNELWWSLRREHQLIACPERAGAADWAAKIHIATAPVYYHNYVLGELFASQLRARIATELREPELVDSLAAGEFLLSRVYRRGAALRWDALVEEATGEALTPAHFLRDFVSIER
jgi:peptidyl-dipeptidase A